MKELLFTAMVGASVGYLMVSITAWELRWHNAFRATGQEVSAGFDLFRFALPGIAFVLIIGSWAFLDFCGIPIRGHAPIVVWTISFSVAFFPRRIILELKKRAEDAARIRAHPYDPLSGKVSGIAKDDLYRHRC
ncbi:MAG: hypothetical protein ABSB13_06425 [Candidatus Binatus sp.]|jgi:hypothetical protein|uniref:hypothetical protein n=1 Tax=Candidatus Binatus sp. TaxID=2811406 RepID=UPI003D0F7C7D